MISVANQYIGVYKFYLTSDKVLIGLARNSIFRNKFAVTYGAELKAEAFWISIAVDLKKFCQTGFSCTYSYMHNGA